MTTTTEQFEQAVRAMASEGASPVEIKRAIDVIFTRIEVEAAVELYGPRKEVSS